MELRNKTVLVTGAGGFIGSHLVERLLKEGCNLRALVHYNSLGRWGWLEALPEAERNAIEVMAGDIRDQDMVRLAVKGVDVVFHLAALIAIPYSYQSPESYVDVNVRGTLNVLQAARDFNIERLLVTSTSEVYGTARYVPIDERHPRQPQSPYSATKISADSLAESFFRSFDLPVVTVRPFNTFGPRQSARAVIPTIISQLLGGAQTISLGDTAPTRDFNFVTDTADGFVAIARADNVIGEEINIATGTEHGIGDVAELLCNLIAPGARVERDEQRIRPKKSEVERLLGNAAKMHALTGWKPQHTLEEGLMETIRWFRNAENLRLYKPHVYAI